MRLVADTNVLFSFFNSESKARELALRPDVLLHSPSFALSELEGHKSEILERFSLSAEQYAFVGKLLASTVKFLPESEYSGFLVSAAQISPDKDDVDFFALALKLRCAIWSEDRALKKQPSIAVVGTKDLLMLLGESK